MASISILRKTMHIDANSHLGCIFTKSLIGTAAIDVQKKKLVILVQAHFNENVRNIMNFVSSY